MIVSLDSPILYVRDIKSAMDFYVAHLGFSLAEDAGTFVSLTVGDVKISLNQADDHTKHPGHQAIILVSSAIEKDYETLKEKGVTIDMSLETLPWGRTFIICDPDGNRIEFVE